MLACRHSWNRDSMSPWRPAGKVLQLQAEESCPRIEYIALSAVLAQSDMRSLTEPLQIKLPGTEWWRSSAWARPGSSRPTQKLSSR